MTSESQTAKIDALIAQLYDAAQTLIESVADHIALEEAPLHHRAQALAAVDRFLDRLEKRKAEIGATADEEEETQVYLEFIHERDIKKETTGQKIFDRDAPPHLTPRFIEDVEGEEWYEGEPDPEHEHVRPRVSPDRVREQITPYAPHSDSAAPINPALIDPSLYAGSW